jgi:hypothetical protein
MKDRSKIPKLILKLNKINKRIKNLVIKRRKIEKELMECK